MDALFKSRDGEQFHIVVTLLPRYSSGIIRCSEILEAPQIVAKKPEVVRSRVEPIVKHQSLNL